MKKLKIGLISLFVIVLIGELGLGVYYLCVHQGEKLANEEASQRSELSKQEEIANKKSLEEEKKREEEKARKQAEIEKRLREAEEKAREAEEKAREAEEKAREAEEKAREMEESTRFSDESTPQKLTYEQPRPSFGEDRSSLDPLIARMAALRCRHSSSAHYQRQLLILLPRIRNGEDVNLTLPGMGGWTALHYACSIASLSITRWLLEHGANPNIAADNGAIPIQQVGYDNRAAIIQLLREHGARDYKVSTPQYSSSSHSGSAQSLYEEGIDWQLGRNGRSQNYGRAFDCYRRAAEAGHAGAQNNVGHFYHQGWAVAKNLHQAAYWYRLAAEKGLPLAQSNYGTCLEFGWGVPRNKSAAIEWYRKGARQGNKSAQRHLQRNGMSW